MRVPLFLLVASGLSALVAYVSTNGAMTAWLAVSILACIAAAILLVRAGYVERTRPLWPRLSPSHPNPSHPKLSHPTPRQSVVIDGSNVMYWDGATPKIDTVKGVIAELKRRGAMPGIVFDANAGHLLADRYLDDRHFAHRLALPVSRVLVVPKGQPADPTILAAARDMNAKVLSNDRFQDWAHEFPEVSASGHVVRGGYRDGALWLDERAWSTV